MHELAALPIGQQAFTGHFQHAPRIALHPHGTAASARVSVSWPPCRPDTEIDWKARAQEAERREAQAWEAYHPLAADRADAAHYRQRLSGLRGLAVVEDHGAAAARAGAREAGGRGAEGVVRAPLRVSSVTVAIPVLNGAAYLDEVLQRGAARRTWTCRSSC